MSELDYRDCVPNEYPEPADRMNAKDYPPSDRLYVYGEDFPMPESMADLRCKYNEDERFPLTLEELEGFKVPPLGMTAVSTAGGGHKQGYLYKFGTFREDRSSMNKEFGIQHTDAMDIWQDKRTEAIYAGFAQSFEEHGYVLNGHEKIKVLAPMAKVALDKAFEGSAREMRMMLEYAYKIQGTKEKDEDGRKDKALDLASQSFDTVQKFLELAEKEIAKKEAPVIEAELYDVEDNESPEVEEAVEETVAGSVL